MVSVEEALKIISNTIEKRNKSKHVSLNAAIGSILFEDVIAPINMPPFRQSAMDGYAIKKHNSNIYKVTGEVKAGDSEQLNMIQGEAVRIFTGAPVPKTANTIVIQEHVTREEDSIVLQNEVSLGANIRPLGEQIKKGDLALKKGTKLTPAAIGFLASLGIKEVTVYKKISIAIVVTGNELIEAGQSLSYGQIYESNATMLSSALFKLGLDDVEILKVKDDYSSTENLLKNAIQKYDVLLISGGISVGDYDFVGKALLNLDVKQHFYKVKQKPGKPLFFGTKEDKVIFALPGNPASALSCFYVYVYKALQLLIGDETSDLPRIKVKVENGFTKKGDRAQFLKAIYRDGFVKILEGQQSSMLHTFSLANALVYIPEALMSLNKNDEVEVILLPTY